RRLRFAATATVVIAMLTLVGGGTRLDRVRTFFGVYTVSEIEKPTATYRFLFHGRINHGGDIVGQPHRPITYYIANGPVGQFDLIILDAFSGDAIPAHLLTREAFQMYLRKLSPTGWLIVHITNTYLDLLPVITATVNDLGLAGRYIDFTGGSPRDYIYSSEWVVAARSMDQ